MDETQLHLKNLYHKHDYVNIREESDRQIMFGHTAKLRNAAIVHINTLEQRLKIGKSYICSSLQLPKDETWTIFYLIVVKT